MPRYTCRRGILGSLAPLNDCNVPQKTSLQTLQAIADFRGECRIGQIDAGPYWVTGYIHIYRRSPRDAEKLYRYAVDDSADFCVRVR